MSDLSSRTYDLDRSLPSGGQAGDMTIRPRIGLAVNALVHARIVEAMS